MIARLIPLVLLLCVALPLAQITRARTDEADPAEFVPSGSGIIRTVQGDVDGDGREDLVTLYVLPSPGTTPPHANLLVVLMADDGPRPVFLFGKTPADMRGEPILDRDGATDMALRDLSGDGRPEIVLRVTNQFQNTAPRQLVWVFGRGEVPPALARENPPPSPPWAGTGFRLEAFVEGTQVDLSGPADPGGSAIRRQDAERVLSGPNPLQMVSETYRWRNDGFRLAERALTLPADSDPSQGPETAVLGYYQAIARGDRAAASAFLGDAAREGAASSRFADPAATLDGLQIEEVRLIETDDRHARADTEQTVYVRGSVAGAGLGQPDAGQMASRQAFAGTWRVRPDGDRWRMVSASLHEMVDLATLADALPGGSSILQTASGDLRNRGADDQAVLARGPGRFTLAEPSVILVEDGQLQPARPLSTFVRRTVAGGVAGQIQIADVNGDGMLEVVYNGIVGAHSSVLWVLGWDGTTLVPLFEENSSTPVISLMDLDDDGIAEITVPQSSYCGSYAAAPSFVFAFRWDDGAYRSATTRYPSLNDGLDERIAEQSAVYAAHQGMDDEHACVQHTLAIAQAVRGRPAEMRTAYRSYAMLRQGADPRFPGAVRPAYVAELYLEADLRSALAAAESGTSPGWGPAELAVLHDLLGDVLDTRASTLESNADRADERNQPDQAAATRQQAEAARAGAKQEYRAALVLDPTDEEARRALGD